MSNLIFEVVKFRLLGEKRTWLLAPSNKFKKSREKLKRLEE